ncbi:hypothetical protein L289_2994 [Acinetobacter gerneri DSM 14967 = CIP 107464 = MTCC 9824]|uniref:Uncharacterized protein n=2 Tax=Acinetobacter gerneri TaxID=202952 RepID=N8YFA0_9GAMM|nr:entry exclusion lipoprotein TrbK [Acinetobacter gerneri]ENV35482.1 hypothetical protein F960_00289 [Acinetobacter gerneri DSM 14967 = CIP 107464 = MTCC 9824]EPR82500.1 hypothetical protein L289_2994 [Acinetobacter gerneri DSM 14967 = CIP 107464 = MTCC 9824]
MQNIRDYVMVGVVAVAAFGGSYFGATPKGQAEGQGQTVADYTASTDTPKIDSYFSMPEVNDENCKPAFINNVNSFHREEFAEKCFKRGTVNKQTSKAY